MIINNSLFPVAGKHNFKNIAYINPIAFKGSKNDTFECSCDDMYKRDLNGAIKALNRKLELLHQHPKVKNKNTLNQDAEFIADESESIKKCIEIIKQCPELAFFFNFEHPLAQRQLEFRTNKDRYIDLHSDEFSFLSKKAKLELVNNILDIVTFQSSKIIAKTQKNMEILEALKSKRAILESELLDIYKITPEVIGAEVLKIKDEKGVEQKYKGIYDISSVMHQEMLSDILVKKVASSGAVKKNNVSLRDFVFIKKTYQTDDGEIFVGHDLVDLENETNLKIINADRGFIEILVESRLLENGIGTDLSDKTNQELIRNARMITPAKSPYNIFASKSEPQIVDIPVEHLVLLGFGTQEKLLELIKNGALKGKIGSKEVCVTLERNESLDANKELKILSEIRDANPKIKEVKDVADALGVTTRQIYRSIFYGEIDIIPYCLTASDKRKVFIDVAAEKNRNYIRKIKFEKEFSLISHEAKRRNFQRAKADKNNPKQKLQELGMALVWEFMPKTREIAFSLAQQDPESSQLLIKELVLEGKLTIKDEIKLNAYRLKFWNLTGDEELNNAFKKATDILKEYKMHGIKAIDKEYLPIFEKHGFR